MKRITTDDAVRALKARKTAHPASAIAADLGVSSRAVATALRRAVNDGRVSINFRPIRRTGVATYRFVRLTSKAQP